MASSAATMALLSFPIPTPVRRRLHLYPIHHHKPPRVASSSSSSSVFSTKSLTVYVSQRTRTILKGSKQYNPATAIDENDGDILRSSTRTLATIMGTSLLLLKLLQYKIPNLVSNFNMNTSMSMSMSTLFFASLRDRPSGYLNTPLTVVAAGLGKWLDIYSGVLMVRVLLSWFPNIPWERQPLSAIRDLCDPYLNLFRNIIPPVFDTLDVSPLLAFAVLGTLGSILQTAMA